MGVGTWGSRLPSLSQRDFWSLGLSTRIRLRRGSRDSNTFYPPHTHWALLGCEVSGVAGAAVHGIRHDFARLPIVWRRPARHELSS